jgi:hypothetical protein
MVYCTGHAHVSSAKWLPLGSSENLAAQQIFDMGYRSITAKIFGPEPPLLVDTPQLSL